MIISLTAACCLAALMAPFTSSKLSLLSSFSLVGVPPTGTQCSISAGSGNLNQFPIHLCHKKTLPQTTIISLAAACCLAALIAHRCLATMHTLQLLKSFSNSGFYKTKSICSGLTPKKLPLPPKTHYRKQ